jgi:ABC-type glycerol-3-phosphate transport system permease component
MPIIGKVGRRHIRVRILNIAIHLLLLTGGVTMIYPFLMMISGSFKSPVDSKDFTVYPHYFVDDGELFRKWTEARYNEMTAMFHSAYRNRFYSFETVTLPQNPSKAAFEDWTKFLAETKESHTVFDFYISEQDAIGVYPRNWIAFQNLLKKENGDLEGVNERYKASFPTWNLVSVHEGRITNRRFSGDYKGLTKRFEEWKLDLPLWHRTYISLDGDFIVNELKPRYRGDLVAMNEAMGTNYVSWLDVTLPRHQPGGKLGEHWADYVKETLNLHFIQGRPSALPLYRAYLEEKYGAIDELNRMYGTEHASFGAVPLPSPIPDAGPILLDWGQFVENACPAEDLEIHSIEFRYRDWLKEKYAGDLQALNDAHARGLNDFNQARLEGEMPRANMREQQDWILFVREHADPTSVAVRGASQTEFLKFLAGKFPGPDEGVDIAAVNAAYATAYEKVRNIYPSRTLPANPTYREDWIAFVRDHVSGRFLEVNADAEHEAWVGFLRGRYETPAKLNDAWEMRYAAFATVPVDHWEMDTFHFRAHKSDIFWEFFTRNYSMVFDEMLVNGNAIINTIIYCALSIGVALLVNPLAAYAMSRYKLPTTYKIILVLMLTMAFPPMVMGIPTFLLLKNLNLLNTFFALVLPTAADGYFIFLLKGFFDSLPQELFESATIDGAKERQIFWNIAMALSKPIMAVIALNAFNRAYRNFMMAFLYCQDHSMWTLMVHIYQLIQRSNMGVGFAALVIASIPTFAVFVFCQNIIIRGIVVPTEK